MITAPDLDWLAFSLFLSGKASTFLATRRAGWKPHIKESQTPWQELQRKFVGQLSSGACLDFAINFQRIAQTKGVPRHSH